MTEETRAISKWLKVVIPNQKELAIRLGMNVNTFRNRLSKGHIPDWFLARICRELDIENIPIRRILEDENLW